jgi:thymidylate kinase
LRNGFLALAEAEPERIKVINAEGTQDEVQELVLEAVTALLKKVQA